MKVIVKILAIGSMVLGFKLNAQEVIELESTKITGNTELPKYTYIVPWQDNKSEQTGSRKLVLHNLYGDLFDPKLPEYISPEDYRLIALPQAEK